MEYILDGLKELGPMNSKDERFINNLIIDLRGKNIEIQRLRAEKAPDLEGLHKLARKLRANGHVAWAERFERELKKMGVKLP